MVLAGDRFGSIDTEENGVLTEEVPTARDVAGFAADIILDEERFDEADVNNCARCARVRDGKLASKTTNGKNRPQKGNIGATAKRTERMLGPTRPSPQYRAIRRCFRTGTGKARLDMPGPKSIFLIHGSAIKNRCK